MMSSIGGQGGPSRNPQIPSTAAGASAAAPARKKKSILRKIADILDPKREPVPVVVLPPAHGLTAGAGADAVRGHPRQEAREAFFVMGLGNTRLNTALERAPNDSRRALVVQELQRMRPDGFSAPTGVFDSDPAAEWADRFVQNDPGLVHLLVDYLVRLYPNPARRITQTNLFEALRTLAMRDPAESSDVVDIIARLCPQGNMANKELVKSLASIRYDRREETVQFARELGFSGELSGGWDAALPALDAVSKSEHSTFIEAFRVATTNARTHGGEVAIALSHVSAKARLPVARALHTALPAGGTPDKLGKTLRALAAVKSEHLEAFAACVSRLCAPTMDGDSIAKVLSALRGLHRTDRSGVANLVANLGANHADGDVLAELIKRVAHIKPADRGCLTLASQFASASSDGQEWYRIIHAFTQVREADRAGVAAAAKTLTQDLTGTQNWPTIIAHLGNMSGPVAQAVAPDAARLVRSNRNFLGAQRAQIAAHLAGIVDPTERANFVSFGEELMRASTARFTNHHPLLQLLQTPVSERRGLTANTLRLCPAGAASASEMESVMNALRKLSAPERSELTDLALRLVRPETADRDFVHVIEKLVSQRPEERRATVAFVESLIPNTAAGATRQQLVNKLVNLPLAERDSVAAACAALLVIQPTSAAVGFMVAVIDTPAGARADHAQTLIGVYNEDLPMTYDAHTPIERVRAAQRNYSTTTARTPGRAEPRPGADRRIFAANQNENVMDRAVIARVKNSIDELRRLFPRPPVRGSQLRRIEAYLNTYPTDGASTAERAVFNLRRGGATEKQNALRVINDPMRSQDYSNSLRQNDPYSLNHGQMGLGDLAELVWFAIEEYSDGNATPAAVANEKSLMRYSFFKALSQCIEDDGHRVCGVGFTQRIMTILQGRIPGVFVDDNVPMVRPQQLVSFVSERFAHDLGERQPSAQELRRFFDANVASARNLYGHGTPDAQIVEDHLQAYLEYEYTNWQSPGRQAQDASFDAWRGEIEQRRQAESSSPESY